MVDEYTKKWLQKAMNDLKVVRNERAVEKENLVTDAICFHAQQAAEKLLKAYLVKNNIEFGKTHNLKKLLNQCIGHDKKFDQLSVGDLTEYAVEIRYPDEFYIPSLKEVNESIQIAENVKKFVFKKLGITENDIFDK
ncbi:MAG: HEPN domain-containing protein [Chitinispirillia bacterium]|jgi:HEPN domain-containing protein